MEKRTQLLYRIKEINKIYLRSSNAQRERIFDAGEFIVNQLVLLGYSRDIVESLELFGVEFLKLDSMVNSEFYRNKYPEMFAVFGV